MAGGLSTHFRQALGPGASKAGRGTGLKVFLDGNLAESVVAHGSDSNTRLVGEDQFGNRYFEKSTAQSGRGRWVVYAKAGDWRSQDPTTIPTEWHGWLHGITDDNPTNHEFQRPVYAVEARGHPSMSPSRHMPKGAWENPARRSWLKFTTWSGSN